MYEMRPVGRVRGGRTEPIDDDWGAVVAVIELDTDVVGADAVMGLDGFSHIDVVYLFHLVEPDTIVRNARHPRGNADWPKVGILAQRAKARPNRIGVTTCELLGVEGTTIRVRGLDAIDSTPVLDVKPYMRAFAPRSEVHEPSWVGELMSGYWGE